MLKTELVWIDQVFEEFLEGVRVCRRPCRGFLNFKSTVEIVTCRVHLKFTFIAMLC